MTNSSCDNYLRAHRKKSGLSQNEVAIILGCDDGGVVSRHEHSRNFPPLPFAVAYEVMFHAPISEIFRGLHETVERTVEGRLSDLERELEGRDGRGRHAAITAKKLMWLMERRTTREDV